ncbi:MAG: O-antigen ligase family protein, partial [Acidimicrobiia bacterium]
AVLAIAYGPDARRRLKDTLTLVIVSQLALLSLGVIGFFLMPDLFGPFESRPGFVSLRTLAPPFMHSNAVSSAGAVVATFALASFLRESYGRRFWAGAFVISIAALILSSGRQGVAMALVGIGLVLWVERRRLLAFFVAPALILTFLTYREEIIGMLSRDRPSNWITLTGRLPWWEAAVTAWERHPWTGWGYSTGGRFVALESIDSGVVSSVHSGYLEVLVGVGIIGLIPFLFALGRILLWSFRQMAAKTETAMAVLIVPLIVRTAVSPGFGGWLNVEFVLFVLLAAVADQSSMDTELEGVGRRRLDQPSLRSSSSISDASL